MMAILEITIFLSCFGYIIAGQGGSFHMINLSGADWKLKSISHYQMNSWKFPSIFKNGETALIYVEFNQGIFHVSKDDCGKVEYELVGTGGKGFRITARGGPFRIEVEYTNLEVDGQKDVTVNLGWNHDGDNNFVIIEHQGKYIATGVGASDWMSHNIDFLGSRSLRKLSIPGTHDSGMSMNNGHTAFGYHCNTQTQGEPILKQLERGSRYFDVRPVIGNKGKYLTGHYGQVGKMWQGANGQSIDSIIADVNEFTKYHHELVIIKLSHSLNTDLGNTKYRSFIREEWDGLFKKLDTINNRYQNDNANVVITDITLNEFTNNGSTAAVLFVVDGGNVQLNERLGKGYFLPKHLEIYDDYTNTDDFNKMVNDQLYKMKQYSKNQYFLLSWILTQRGMEPAFCNPSIKSLAKKADSQLSRKLYPIASKESFPNIILVDYQEFVDVTSLALAINKKVNF